MSGRGPMRLGALNLLVTVIALCLAVLAVLSLVTVKASADLVGRQGELLQRSYALESEGQRFAAAVDGALAQARAAGLDGFGALAFLQDSLEPDVGADSGGAQIQVMDGPALEGLLGRPSEGSWAGAVQGVFQAQDGQRLTCLLAITPQARWQVLSWTMTRSWEEGAQDERLWQG